MNPKVLSTHTALLAATIGSAVFCAPRVRAQSNWPTMKFGATTTRVEPNMKMVLQQFKKMNPVPLSRTTPSVARRGPTAADAATAVLKMKGKSTAPMPVGSVQNTTVPGPGGRAVPVRIYKPKGSGPFPVIVYIHGGGFVIASIQDYDASCRALANGAKAMVVSVGYSYAPENKVPTQHEESYAVLQHVMNNADQMGGDSKRVAVAGESAGGHVAASLCIMARDRKGKMPVHQLLVYPITQAYTFNTPSYRKWAKAVPLDRSGMMWFAFYALPSKAFGRTPKATLLRANVRGLPPATIVNAEIDPLEWDGAAYANHLRAAGVPVQRRLFVGSSRVDLQACKLEYSIVSPK